MKKLLTIAFSLLLLALDSYSQNNNWKLDGNTATNSSFIGTLNNEAFVIKANGIEGLRLKPNGDLKVASFDNMTDGLVWSNQNGVLKKISFTGNNNDFLSGNGTFLSLSTISSGWSLASGVTFTNNNVGIGTNYAPEKLTVNGNIVANGSISGTSINVIDIVGAGKEFKINQSLTMKGIDLNTPGSRNELIGENGDFYIQSEHNNNYNTVFNLGNNGKVGFGIIPTEDFHVGKSAKFDGGINLSNLSNSNSGDLLFIDGSGKVTRGSMDALVADVYSIECLTDINGTILPTWHTGDSKITTGGTQCEFGVKVGINTDSPANHLDVRGDGSVSGKFAVNTLTAVNELDIRGDASISKHLGVGLTTLNTNYKLHVKTVAETGIHVDASFTYDNLSAITTVIDRDLTKAFSVIDSRNGQENFKVNGNGFVYARRFWVTLDPFPDYVFSDNYNLMSLTELETYIDNNNHLPKIPTATEVSQNGVELGEMNRLLVEKVEELTLYLIEQNKKLEELSKEIELLKK